MQFAPRMYGSLFLCLILVYLGTVKGISHGKFIKRVNQQSDAEFAPPVDK